MLLGAREAAANGSLCIDAKYFNLSAPSLLQRFYKQYEVF